jgi:hypothetical protein
MIENTPIFYNNEALRVVRRAWNISDWGHRLAGFWIVFVVNVTK